MKCKKVCTIVLFTIAIFAISVVTIWDFSMQLQNMLTRETYQTLSEVSKDYNKAFLDRISYNIKTMNVLAGTLDEMQECTKQEAMRILQNAVDDGGFEKMVVCDAKGVSYSNNGISGNVAQREYFKKAMQGITNISQPLISSVNGEECIVIAVPIQNKEDITGVLFGVYPLATAGEQLLDFSYYIEGYGMVVSPNGTILISSKHKDKLTDGKNLFTFFEKTEFKNFSLDELKASMKKGESKSFAFTYNGEKRFVSFTPSKVNDWYTFSLTSDAAMQQEKKATNQIVVGLVFRISVAALLLFAWIFCLNRRHNKAILEASQQYQSLLEHINGGMIVAMHSKTADETIATYVSSGFTDMTGYTLEDIKEIHNGRYLSVLFEDDRKLAFDKYLEQIKTGNTYNMPYRIRKKDGSLIWVMDNGYLVKDKDGLHNHSIITDITIIKQQEEELRMSEERFSIAINASSGTLFEVDLKNQLYTHFENSERIFGISAEKLLADTREFASLPYNDFVEAVTEYFFHPDDRVLTKNEMKKLLKNKTASYEARLRRFDDSYIWARIDLILTLDEFGLQTRLLGFMSDINDIKKKAEILENKVQTDPLTGLYNKIAVATLINKIIEEYPNGRHALIILDIDNFKGINDTLGHAFGDLVLIEICSKLKTLVRSSDVVGRIGGDEFAIMLRGVPDTSSVMKKATELSGACRQTYSGEKEDYKISCSMGIVLMEHSKDTFETLYRKADAALYQAKQTGKDQFLIYQEENADLYPIKSQKTNDEEMQNLKVSHDISTHIFELLYTSKDFNVSINMALAALGQEYHTSRVSIFENDENNLVTGNIYEWCNAGIVPEINNMQNVPLVCGSESVLDSFDQNGLLYCNDVRELPPYLRQILEKQGIKSNLQVTITNEEKICGFIGFEDCDDYRVWTLEEIEKLSFLSRVLSVFLFKRKTEVALLENLHTRLQILDVLPNYVCVVNPETHQLVYANRKMQELLPMAQPGTFCFTTLRGGQRAPCKVCLMERIKQGDTDNLEIVSEDKELRLKVNAISINWTKDQEMVLLYGTNTTSCTL
ncbi:MAG: diguanylate cyclase [Oscillospiraceae bacterium]